MTILCVEVVSLPKVSYVSLAINYFPSHPPGHQPTWSPTSLFSLGQPVPGEGNQKSKRLVERGELLGEREWKMSHSL